MKLSKSLLVITFITVFSLLFVWQQTEIFRLAYDGQKIETEFRNSLDKNSVLRYNLKTNTSLTRIYGKISMPEDFQLPDAYMLVRLTPPASQARSHRPPVIKEENLLARVFGVNRSAEAKTVASTANPTRIITITAPR
ncbi:MAG: hypothetical protein PHC33_04185 [Candidatus Omnitrophica bacterium]|nr:hypothetical protein [Candidatus Omnitrophota bacterium]